jgi:hypothetical protein
MPEMERDTELLKIQTYADYCNSRFTIDASYVLSVVVAYYITILGLNIQKVFSPPELYYLFLIVPFPFFAYMLHKAYRNHVRNMSRVDELIKKLNVMESIPTVNDLISGKAWEKKS